MSTWARVKDAQNDVEVTHLNPAGRYAPPIEAQFFLCNDAVTTGSLWSGANPMLLSSWTIYSPPVPPSPGPPVPPVVTAARFYNLFGLQSSIDIKNSMDSTGFVQEMYHRVNLLIASNDTINMNTTFVQSMLGYLETTAVTPATSPTRNYITAADVTRILSNVLPSM